MTEPHVWADIMATEGATVPSPTADADETPEDLGPTKRVIEEKLMPDGKRVKIQKIYRLVEVTRAANSVEIRRNRLVRFNKGLEADDSLVHAEPPVMLEFGYDPVDRECRTEVNNLMTVAKTQKDLKLPREIAQLKKALNETKLQTEPAAPAVETAAPAEPAAKKTYAEARKEKKEAERQSQGKTEGGPAKKKDTIRVQNFIDHISEAELRRLLGEDNVELWANFRTEKRMKYDPGHIVRFIAPIDKQTQNRRGFAYVTYSSDEEAAHVIKQLPQIRFKSTVMVVDYGTEMTWARRN